VVFEVGGRFEVVLFFFFRKDLVVLERCMGKLADEEFHTLSGPPLIYPSVPC
jgi:hypothetical protein